MGQLLFKKVFWDAIRGGTKRTTIRRWTTPRVTAGRRAFAPGVGWLHIESVDVVRLEQLSDADARADGFETALELRAALRDLYPAQDADGRSWFRVAFRQEDASDASTGAPADTPTGAKPRAADHDAGARTALEALPTRVRSKTNGRAPRSKARKRRASSK